MAEQNNASNNNIANNTPEQTTQQTNNTKTNIQHGTWNKENTKGPIPFARNGLFLSSHFSSLFLFLLALHPFFFPIPFITLFASIDSIILGHKW